jgi:hypothetical protein
MTFQISALTTISRSHRILRSHPLLATALLVLSPATFLHAQNTAPPPSTDQEVLPAIGAPTGFTGTTTAPSGLQPASSYAHTEHHDAGSARHPQSAAPFKIPHSITKTTASGTKFQFTLPRVGFRAGNGQVGRVSPLDSNATPSMGARTTNFPTGNNFLQPNDASSDNMFGSVPDASDASTDGLAPMSRGSHGGSGGGARGGGPAGGGGAGGLGINVKSSIFNVHVGLSMKDMMGGTFSQNASSASSAGYGATDFSAGGPRTAGSEGHGGAGAGAKLSLGLRF